MGRRGRGAALVAGAMVSLVSLAQATTLQSGNLRITVLAQIAPFELPRAGTAPISASVAGHLEDPHGGTPPQLQTMKIDVNRHALLQSRGLPTCPLARIQPGSTSRALSTCGDALIGSGRFWASIVLPEQGSYPTHGRLLVFNGRLHGRPAILAHIYTRDPFDSSFVVAFKISKVAKGSYGTELTASLPESLGEWGYVNRIKLTLKREYRFKGRQLSYFNAGCPAVAGARLAVYPLARVSLGFTEQRIAATVTKRCAVAR